MDYKRIHLSFSSLALDEFALLIDVKLRYQYDKNNKRTEEVIGSDYTLVLPKNGFEKLVIRTDEQKPAITEEEIEANGGSIEVQPVNFSARLYKTSTGEIGISATATTVKEV